MILTILFICFYLPARLGNTPGDQLLVILTSLRTALKTILTWHPIFPLLPVTSKSIGQFQPYWTKERRSQRELRSYRLHRKLQATQRRHYGSDSHKITPVTFVSRLRCAGSQMGACTLLSNYSARGDCTYMQGQQKISL